MNKKKILIGVAVLIALIIIIFAVSNGDSSDNTKTTSQVAVEDSYVQGDLEQLKQSPKANDQFKQVEEGMSSSEVKSIMSTEPVVHESTNENYDQMDSYEMNESRYDFYFKGDKLVGASIVEIA